MMELNKTRGGGGEGELVIKTKYTFKNRVASKNFSIRILSKNIYELNVINS